MEKDSVKCRVKRGLIDAGGWLLGRVFGLAMGDDVNELRDMVIQGYAQTTSLSHTVGQMSSTVNQLIDEQAKTCRYLTHIKELSRSWKKAWKIWWWTWIKPISLYSNRRCSPLGYLRLRESKSQSVVRGRNTTKSGQVWKRGDSPSMFCSVPDL